TKQDVAVDSNRAEMVVRWLRRRKPQEKLVPRKASGNVFDSDDRPQVLHRDPRRLIRSSTPRDQSAPGYLALDALACCVHSTLSPRYVRPSSTSKSIDE